KRKRVGRIEIQLVDSTRSQIQIKDSPPPSAQRGVLQRACACGNHMLAGGECDACSKKKGAMQLLRMRSQSEPVNEVPPIVHEVLRSPGQPLDAATQAFMEPRFGHDFSQVRLHTDFQAAKSARAVNALAYTVGHHIVFGPNQFAPQSFEGRRLLAHELTHTLQQSRRGLGSLDFARLDVGEANSTAERESETVADTVMSASPHGTSFSARPVHTVRQGRLQRKVSPSLPNIKHALRKRGFFEKDISAADTHQVLLIFK